MTLWNEKSAAEATGGKAQGAWEAGRVEIDSRRVQKGDLFVAIKGERFDGHDFLAEVFKKGAAAAMVSREAQGGPLLIVPDTLKALEDLGRYARKKTTAKIVGVTGSVGKTSAKEMIKLALAAHGETYASGGNFNNHIGMPLSLANMPESAKFGVFEMGMNHAGEILHLTKMVQPHVAVITNVEAVHLEFFESVEKIADAKAEIFEGLEKGGVAVLNADSPYCDRLKQAAMRKNVRTYVFFGEAAADCRLLSYRVTAAGCVVEASIRGKSLAYTLGAIGRHWAYTSLLALAVAQALGLDVEKSAAALAAFAEPEGRGRSFSLGGATLVDDSYNASPVSMKAAFAKTLELWEAKGKAGRKVALLGDMLELGAESKALHVALAADLAGSKFDVVFTAGTAMKALHDALPQAMRGAHMEKAMALLPIILREMRAGDVILIKGSHGSHMYELAKALKETKPTSGEKKHAV